MGSGYFSEASIFVFHPQVTRNLTTDDMDAHG